jgi:hypothetical protein
MSISEPLKIKMILFLIAISFLSVGCCRKDPPLDKAGKAYKSGNYNKAAEIFYPAAEEGNPEAMVNVAFMYYCGLHFEKDHKEAAKWYEKAAKMNHVNAQFSLGTLYENGEGVARNIEKAYYWYSLAEMQGDKDAGKLKKELEKIISKQKIAKIKKQVRSFKPVR